MGGGARGVGGDVRKGEGWTWVRVAGDGERDCGVGEGDVALGYDQQAYLGKRPLVVENGRKFGAGCAVSSLPDEVDEEGGLLVGMTPCGRSSGPAPARQRTAITTTYPPAASRPSTPPGICDCCRWL